MLIGDGILLIQREKTNKIRAEEETPAVRPAAEDGRARDRRGMINVTFES